MKSSLTSELDHFPELGLDNLMESQRPCKIREEGSSRTGWRIPEPGAENLLEPWSFSQSQQCCGPINTSEILSRGREIFPEPDTAFLFPDSQSRCFLELEIEPLGDREPSISCEQKNISFRLRETTLPLPAGRKESGGHHAVGPSKDTK